MISIRTKFIVLTLGCIIATSGVIGGMGIVNTARVEDEHSGHTMNLACAEKAQMLDGLFARVEQASHLLSSHVLRRLHSVDRLKDDPAYREYFFKEISASALNAASYTEGALGSFVRFNPELLPPTAGVYWHRSKAGIQFESLPTTDLSLYSQEEKGRVGWYYAPVKAGRPTWIEPYYDLNTDTDIISYVVPLYVEGQLLGVAGMDIEYRLLTDAVQDFKLEHHGYAYLTDSAAGIMFHPELKRGTQLPPVVAH